jgi:hypothetical protein
VWLHSFSINSSSACSQRCAVQKESKLVCRMQHVVSVWVFVEGSTRQICVPAAELPSCTLSCVAQAHGLQVLARPWKGVLLIVARHAAVLVELSLRAASWKHNIIGLVFQQLALAEDSCPAG